MESGIFSIITQTSVSHESFRIILICWFDGQKHFLLLSILKTVVLHDIISFDQFNASLLNEKIMSYLMNTVNLWMNLMNTLLYVNFYAYFFVPSIYLNK